MKLTKQQQVLAIAAGMVGATYRPTENRIVIRIHNGLVGWDAEGKFFADLSKVNQSDKWKLGYAKKFSRDYAASTAIVEKVLASKGTAI